ncbi:T9SS type A sorting domain-containing protein, partial [Tenacibaculum agarivorans]|uniref:T9SS type A sorting domain-containing protein n=1 Tax=Tenacibaculum agarivorans TaxID=1908389 RepID=UPI00094BB6FB
GSGQADVPANCADHPGTQIDNTSDSFDSSGAVIITSAIWTGATDSDWSTAGNWDINVLPETTYDLTIPNVANSPVIGIGTSAQMDDLTVEASSSLVLLDMSSAQVDGNFVNNGTVTLNSGASNSSALLVKGTASGSGTVTYLRGGLVANEWHVVSSPVVGQSIKEFAENAANDIRVNTTASPNRYAIAYYDDSNADGSKWVYYTATDLATTALTFEQGRSYAVSRATDGSVTFTGTLETSSVAKSVVASEWNAIGNPFTAFLPLNENSGDNFIADNSAVMDAAFVAAYVWDNAQGKYVANSLVSDASTVAPGEGFFIRTGASASPISVTLDQDQRLTEAAPVIVSRGITNTNTTPSIELVATSNNVSVTTGIKYFSKATKGLDPGYDVGNFGGASFDVYTHLLEGSIEDFTVQSLPDSGYETMVVPVGLQLEENTSVAFSLTSENLPSGVEVYLEDQEKGSFTRLDNGSNYTITSTSKISGVGRFYIHTISQQLSTDDITEDITNVKIYTSAKRELTIAGLQTQATVSMYSIAGQEVLSTAITSNGSSVISLPRSSAGVYIVKLEAGLGSITKKIILE